jgi:hypothetical protein
MSRFDEMKPQDVLDFASDKLRKGFKRALSKNKGEKNGPKPLSTRIMFVGPFRSKSDFSNFEVTFAKNFEQGIPPDIAGTTPSPAFPIRRDVNMGGSVFTVQAGYSRHGIELQILWVVVGEEDPWKVPPLIEQQ